MRGRNFVFLIFGILLACSEVNLPKGYYDYQVERLLSGEEGSKIWHQVVNTQECLDSIRLLIETAGDSLDFSLLTHSGSCQFLDTSYLGRGNATHLSGSILFTDSIRFQNDDFWIIKSITSQYLEIEVNEEKQSYQASF